MLRLRIASHRAVAVGRAALTSGMIGLVTSAATLFAPAAGEVSAASTPMPTCAWSRKAGVTAANLYWPDSSAVYWSTVYPVDDDLRITVTGVFPDARYMSFNVYDENTAEFRYNDIVSGLPDYRIKADDRGLNPWRRPGEAGGRFTVTVRPDAEPGQENTLPLAPSGVPAGAKASLIFRVYLPTGGDSTIELPTITLTQGGVSTTLPRCTSGSGGSGSATSAGQVVSTAAGSTAAGQAAAGQTAIGQTASGQAAFPAAGLPRPAGARVFARTSEVSQLAPNADNGYLGAWITPPGPDEVVLIRGRAPRAVSGTHPTPWPRLLTDVRYWSMCTNLGGVQKPVVVNRLSDGRVNYGCRYNDETTVDQTGHYTFVLGTEEQRAKIEAMEKVTFLPFSAAQPHAPHMVLLRNLLPTPTFPSAIQNVPVDSTPDDTAAIMGPYYPLVSTCALESLIVRGPARCKPERR